jgi:hypothetical protein
MSMKQSLIKLAMKPEQLCSQVKRRHMNEPPQKKSRNQEMLYEEKATQERLISFSFNQF